MEKSNLITAEQKKMEAISKRLNGTKMILTQAQMNEVEREFWRRTNFEPFNVIRYINRTFAIDAESKRYYFTPYFGKHDFRINFIDEIIEIELSENNNTLIKSSGGTGGAIAGGILFGAAGAVVGSTFKNTKSSVMVDSLCINIVTSDKKNPFVKLDFIKSPIARDKYYKPIFETAQRIFSLLKSTLHSKQSNENTVPGSDGDIINQLKELASLHDSGAITDDEFVLAKQKILK